MRLVTSLIHSILKRKRDELKKVLDKLAEAEYNELIKNGEWLLAISVHFDKRKKKRAQKVLDKRARIRYNESIKRDKNGSYLLALKET